MTKLEYTVSFTTPAFLGNAEQQAQWRTPPFKALIRQWWRISAGSECDYDHSKLREKEGTLFGNAWLTSRNNESLHRKSDLRIRLIPWSEGQLTSEGWPGGPMEQVPTTADGKRSVRADVYLGFGPVLPASRKEQRTTIGLRGAAIPPDESTARLQIFSTDVTNSMTTVLQLIAWFGTVGSRSRNGWGSVRLESSGDSPAFSSIPSAKEILLNNLCRDWVKCLSLDWPHALGALSDKPLIWVTPPYQDWRKVMGCLAHVRIEARRAAKRFKGPGGIGGVHFLGYPVGGRWNLSQADKDARFASQLRSKVLKTTEGLVGMISHWPCRIPEDFRRRLNLKKEQNDWLDKEQISVWEAIHKVLNSSKRLKLFG